SGAVVLEKVYYSVGGGFVVGADGHAESAAAEPEARQPYPFDTGDELLARCDEHGLSVATLMLENEKALRPEPEVRARVLGLWAAMEACLRRGCEKEGILPGGLKVRRR